MFKLSTRHDSFICPNALTLPLNLNFLRKFSWRRYSLLEWIQFRALIWDIRRIDLLNVLGAFSTFLGCDRFDARCPHVILRLFGFFSFLVNYWRRGLIIWFHRFTVYIKCIRLVGLRYLRLIQFEFRNVFLQISS
jgi:hypothetical protein